MRPRPVPEAPTGPARPRPVLERAVSVGDRWGLPAADPTRRILASYAERHARILDPSDSAVPKRFVVFPEEYPWHGLGNRQLTYLYAFLVALLTGRALIGRPFPDAERCYDLPIRCSAEEVRRCLGLDLNSEPAYRECVEALAGMRYPDWASTETMACADYRELDASRYLLLHGGDVAVYRWETGIPHAVYAAANPHHRAFVEVGFAGRPAHHLSRFLFRPSAAVRAAMATALGGADPATTVGVHVRCGRGPLDLYLYSRRATRLYWDAVQALLSDAGGSNRRILLATDSEAARGEARAIFGTQLLHADAEARPDGERFAAVVDQSLLATCRDLVLTDRSTFGYIAQAIAGAVPWVVDGKLERVWRPGGPEAGLHKAGLYEVESVWPWQERKLRRCSCAAAVRRALELGDAQTAGLPARWRWLARIELPGMVQRFSYRWGWRLKAWVPGWLRRALRRAAGW